MKKVLMSILSLFLLVGCVKEKVLYNESLKIAIASDIHYFAKENYEQCEWFEEMMLYGDGKMVFYGDEIIDSFIKDVISKDVDCVILTGDLTFNGEKNSHEYLAKQFQLLEKEGIDVFVLPGNHDIENIFAKGYGKDDYLELDSISGQEFKDIYHSLGYDLAVSKHKDSLSYEILLNNKYSLFLLDSNKHELTGSHSVNSGGIISDSTLKWLKKRLEKDKEYIPLIAMHHNLFEHNEVLNNGYVIDNSETLFELFNDYHVPVVFSGHIHVQSIKEENDIVEIVTSSLVDNPLQYGVVEINQKTIDYHNETLSISVDSKDYFDTVSRHRFYQDETSYEASLKREVMVLANRYYFAGNIKDKEEEIKKSEGFQLIQKEDSFYKDYLNSMLKNNQDNNHMTIQIKEQ